MTVKLIGVCLTLSCIFLCALGNLKITKEQLAQFKGSDPTNYCGSKPNMEKFCSAIVQIDTGKPETECFKQGYPQCGTEQVKVVTKCGKGTEFTPVRVIICSWGKEKLYYIYGKGQSPNNVMNYILDNNGDCIFYKDYPYDGK